MRECIENDWLPFCLGIGISYDLFGKLNPRKIMPFEKANSEKTKRDQKEKIEFINLSTWLNGVYMTKAISACFSKDSKYPEKPIDLESDKPEKTLEENAENFREYAIAFNIQRRKKLQESGAKIDARS